MMFQMRTISVLFLSISIALNGCAQSAAQDASQQPLPSAPSASKYPPKPATPPPASNSAQAPVTAPASQAPSPQPAPATTAPAAQSAPLAADDQGEKLTTIVKQVDEVNVVFTVTDKRGKFVNDLKKEDFQIVDDGKPALSIRSFRAETNLPLRVGLLIDASNSIRDRFKFEQEAAIEFLNQIVHQQDQAFVMGFDTTPEVTQNFTNSTEALAKGVRMLRPGGGPAMYDAIYAACRDEIM